MSKGVVRILYLSGTIEPHREGISKEVFALHGHFEGSYVIGTSPDGRFLISQRERFMGIPGRLLPALRYWVCFVARNFGLIHIFHGIDCYHYLKVKGNKPIILTAISIDHILSMDHYRNLRAIVVESSRDRDRLIANGFDPKKVVVIYPGSDLSVFNDKEPPPEGRFKILFASSPFALQYMESRGVRLLLEAAKIKSDVEFVLLWRKRGDTLQLLQQWISELALTNVRVVNEDIDDMNKMYRESHATVVPFTSEKNTKSCPNSAIESLATGRPVLVSDQVGIADIVRAEQSGIVFHPDAESLAEAITSLQDDYAAVQKTARPCANRHFDQQVFLSAYERLYAAVELTTRSKV